MDQYQSTFQDTREETRNQNTMPPMVETQGTYESIRIIKNYHICREDIKANEYQVTRKTKSTISSLEKNYGSQSKEILRFLGEKKSETFHQVHSWCQDFFFCKVKLRNIQ